MDPISIIVQLLISVSMMAVGSILSSQSLRESNDLEDWEEISVTETRAIPYVVGLVHIKGLNLLWYGEDSVGWRTTSKKDSKGG